MNEPKPQRLQDYRPAAFLVDNVFLGLDLYEDFVLVRCVQELRRNPAATPDAALTLYGRDLELVVLRLDGEELGAERFCIQGEEMRLTGLPDACVLEVGTRIYPSANTALEGLYRSGGMFCTQCEAEGFRRITWFPDRPDVLARYTTTITADREKYPLLLAGGNLLDQGGMPGGRHFVTWRDPFPKPSYLFAMVAGDLVRVADTFTTMSGRGVDLEIYVEAHNRDRCGHAMEALKKAMRWDEESFGLEYDLNRYMIVAVDDFNMGAMENKGLNIFNAKYVLALPETATDDDFDNIERVIAHEYFHNWTGNRVTCRDWFQLSLKEGLTVFRDQLFCEDTQSRGVKRIADVQLLRERQFAEDAGPLAHPVRPTSYIEISNFYTLTIYDKGAEIIRMLHTILGPVFFREGLRRYLFRHDGSAATVEDFVAAMAESGGIDLAQFIRWYSQPGTPVLRADVSHDPAARRLTLTLSQICPSTGQEGAAFFHIPVALGIFDRAGREMTLSQQDASSSCGESGCLLHCTKERQDFFFENIAAPPVVSLLRGFSAPVRLDFALSDQELRLLLAHESDPFNRWESGQILAGRLLLGLAGKWRAEEELALDEEFVAVYRDLVAGAVSAADRSFFASLLSLPGFDSLALLMEEIDVDGLDAARQYLRRQLATRLRHEWEALHAAFAGAGPYRHGARASGGRRLKNLALDFLLALDAPEMQDLALRQFKEADNMTDSLAAMRVLVHAGAPAADEVLARFEARWRENPLVMDKWLTVQATAPQPGTLARLGFLMGHPSFRLTNPNRVRALIGAFAAHNPLCFHDKSGAGYRFLARQILALDPLNPQTAARLAGQLSRWRRYDPGRRELMRSELCALLAARPISRDLYEVLLKSLE